MPPCPRKGMFWSKMAGGTSRETPPDSASSSTPPLAASRLPGHAGLCLPSGPSRLLVPLPGTFLAGPRVSVGPPPTPGLSLTTAAPTSPSHPSCSPWLSTDFCDHPFRPSLPLARKLSRDLDLHCVIHRCHLGPQPGAWLPAQCVFVDVGGQETRLKAGRGAESCGNRKSRPRAPVPSLALLGKRSQAPRASVSLVCEMGG